MGQFGSIGDDFGATSANFGAASSNFGGDFGAGTGTVSKFTLADLLASELGVDALALFIPTDDYVTVDGNGVTNWVAANDATMEMTQSSDASKPDYVSGLYVETIVSTTHHLNFDDTLNAALSGIDDISVFAVCGDVEAAKGLWQIRANTGAEQLKSEDSGSAGTAMRGLDRRSATNSIATLGAHSYEPSVYRYHAVSSDRNTILRIRRGDSTADDATGLEDLATPTYSTTSRIGRTDSAYGANRFYIFAVFDSYNAETKHATYRAILNSYLAGIGAGFTI